MSNSTDARFEAVYRAHAHQGYAYCLRRTTAEEAKDAASDVFVVAWRRFDDIPNGDEALPWLYGVARNTLTNRSRSRRRRDRLNALAAAQHEETVPGPETQIVRLEEHTELLKALSKLSRKDQEILRLVEWESVTEPEAAPVSPVESEQATASDALSDKQQEFVEGLVTAFNAGEYGTYPGNVDTFIGYLDPEAVVKSSIGGASSFSGPLGPTDVATFRSELAFRAAMNSEMEIVSCRLAFGGISCQVDISSGRYVGVDGPVRSGLRITVEDGAVTSLTITENTIASDPGTTSFYAWVEENHAGSLPLMVRDNRTVGTPVFTEESIDLWLELLPEYAATLNARTAGRGRRETGSRWYRLPV